MLQGKNVTKSKKALGKDNQYAKVANGTGYVGAGDIEDLKTRLNEIWAMTKAVMKRLAAII